MPRGFFGNLIFANIARMFCGNHLSNDVTYYQAELTLNSLSNVNIIAFTGTMSGEECSDEVLQLSILHCERTNVLGSLRGHRGDVLPTFLQEVPISSVFHFGGPFAAIRYRLGIIQDANQEIWSCNMAPTSHGFSVVSKSVVHFYALTA